MTEAVAERIQNIGPRLGRPIMKQPTFNWEAGDKYNKQTRGKQYLQIIQHTTSRTDSNHKKNG